MAEMTIRRKPLIGNLHNVEFWNDDGRPMRYLQSPGNILRNLHNNILGVRFVHFVGGGKPNKTYRRPTPRATDGAICPRCEGRGGALGKEGNLLAQCPECKGLGQI